MKLRVINGIDNRNVRNQHHWSIPVAPHHEPYHPVVLPHTTGNPSYMLHVIAYLHVTHAVDFPSGPPNQLHGPIETNDLSPR
jgi:hypothetical protein